MLFWPLNTSSDPIIEARFSVRFRLFESGQKPGNHVCQSFCMWAKDDADADGGDAEADMVFVAATDRKVVSAFESIGQMRTIDRSMYGRMDAILPRGAPHSSLGRVSRSATHASGFQCSCSCSFLGKFVEYISQGLNVHNVAIMGFFKSNETLL